MEGRKIYSETREGINLFGGFIGSRNNSNLKMHPFPFHYYQNEEAWVELFIDLVYVVLLGKLGNVLCYCPISFPIFFKIIFIFWGMCLTRQCIDEYSNRSEIYLAVFKPSFFFILTCFKVLFSRSAA